MVPFGDKKTFFGTNLKKSLKVGPFDLLLFRFFLVWYFETLKGRRQNNCRIRWIIRCDDGPLGPKGFKICQGRFYEKLRKQFLDTQRVLFMLDKTRTAFFPNCRKTVQSSMLAKRFIFSTSRGDFHKYKLEKHGIVSIKGRSLKKQIRI